MKPTSVPMGEQENGIARATRGGKKRAAAAVAGQSLVQLPTNKKRVVLGELTNTPGIELTRCDWVDPQKPKTRSTKPRKTTTKKNNQEPPQPGEKCCYASSIYQHLHSLEMEEKRRPFPNYMERIQKDMTANMREILVDWLVEVAEEYKLVSDTLYLTVSYIDRFLSTHAINRNKLQLLGVTCMLVASKYEEIAPPHVEDFCYITDNTYKKEEVVDMERDVLKFLDFEMGNPTTKTFLRVFMRAAQEDPNSPDLMLEFLGGYLADLTLLDYECIFFLPSVIAASAIFLAKFTIDPEMHPWNSALQKSSGYQPADLRDCVIAIHELQQGKRRTFSRALKEKYMQPKFKQVASVSSPPAIPVHYFVAL
ncbi:Cyclin-A3-1 [Ancistrocladus abbreviatus]